MRFSLVQKLVTLNGIMAIILRNSTEFSSFGGQLQTYTVCDKNVVQRI